MRRSARVSCAVACGLVATAALLARSAPASARERCARVVVFTLPGITWANARAARMPALMTLAGDGSVGSVSVRTNRPHTSYAEGFASLGAGARLDAPASAGAPAAAPRAGPASGERKTLVRGEVASGVEEMQQLAAEAGYGARPGALGSALTHVDVAAVGNADRGDPPPLAAGFGRWTLLAAMDARGRVDLAATEGNLLRARPDAPYGVVTAPRPMRTAVDAVLARPCSVLFVDQGDVARADMAALAPPRTYDARLDRSWALARADDLLAHIRRSLDLERDLLLVVSPTSPANAEQTHLGVAVAVGPGFDAGSMLQSASTRRRGIVTLPDVAPTVLHHLGVRAPPAMNGRPWYAVDAASTAPIDDAVSLDAESVFIDGLKSSVGTGFVVVQVVVYAAAIPLLAARRRLRRAVVWWPEVISLAVVAFPLSTYVGGIFPGHRLGTVGYVAVLVAIDAGVVGAAVLAASDPLRRMLVIVGSTLLVIAADLVTFAALQLNTVFGYSPIVAGRFAGVGNVAFAVLGASGLITGTLIVHARGGARGALVVTALLYIAVVVVDGAPRFGADVGGTLALVPSLALTWLLLSGRRPDSRAVALGLAGGLLAVGVFLVVDLSRPPQERTHLARLFEDVVRRGAGVLLDAIERKARSNIDVFRSSVYTLFVPPALAVMAWLLRRPQGRWERLARAYPRVRAGLVGGLSLAVLGFAVNDSGIVIPAVVLSYLVPLTVLVHIALETDRRDAASTEGSYEEGGPAP